MAVFYFAIVDTTEKGSSFPKISKRRNDLHSAKLSISYSTIRVVQGKGG